MPCLVTLSIRFSEYGFIEEYNKLANQLLNITILAYGAYAISLEFFTSSATDALIGFQLTSDFRDHPTWANLWYRRN